MDQFYQPTAHRFRDSGESRRHAEALASVRSQFGRHFPLFIGGQDIDTSEHGESTDPGDKTRSRRDLRHGTHEHVDQAVAAAKAALPDWHDLGAAGRAPVSLQSRRSHARASLRTGRLGSL